MDLFDSRTQKDKFLEAKQKLNELLNQCLNDDIAIMAGIAYLDEDSGYSFSFVSGGDLNLCSRLKLESDRLLNYRLVLNNKNSAFIT